jgi:hypothetical protein
MAVKLLWISKRNTVFFLRILWSDTEMLALATALPLSIILVYAQFWFYNNLVYSIVLFTSLRMQVKL